MVPCFAESVHPPEVELLAKPLTLKEAVRTNQLKEFVKQEEERGVPAVDPAELDVALRVLARLNQSEDQTSHSSSDGCSTEK